MKLAKTNQSYILKPEVQKAILSMGKDGYDYRKTKEVLIKATERMLEHFADLEKDK